jgi:hypothetical protein
MAGLLTIQELSIWLRQPVEQLDVAFAAVVIEGVSLLVREAASHPEWEAGTVPPRAKLIASVASMRNYNNPDAVAAEGSIGPIGGNRYVEDYARSFELTASEIETLQGMAGEDEIPGSSADMWILPTTRGDKPVAPLYLNDQYGYEPIAYATPDEVPWAYTPEQT